MNLIVLSGFFFFTHTQPNGSLLQSIAVGLSAGLAFLQFCGTLLHAAITPWCCKGLRTTINPITHMLFAEQNWS